MGEIRQMRSIYILVKNLNLGLLVFAILSLTICICYKLWLLDAYGSCQKFVSISEIFYPILLSIPPAYVIYVFTSELKSLKIRRSLATKYLIIHGGIEKIVIGFISGFGLDVDDQIEEIEEKLSLHINSVSYGGRDDAMRKDVLSYMYDSFYKMKDDIFKKIGEINHYSSFFSHKLIEEEMSLAFTARYSSLRDLSEFIGVLSLKNLATEISLFLWYVESYKKVLEKEYKRFR